VTTIQLPYCAICVTRVVLMAIARGLCFMNPAIDGAAEHALNDV
jgi:hypothetical protein